MTIYYNPIGSPDPDPTVQVDYYEIYQDGTKLGEPPEPLDYGMPDSIGGVAPDAVRDFVTDQTQKSAYEADRRTDYVRGLPP